ncbi:transcription termination/antitermination factor NusG [Ornithobacterium rhinotracheale]|uniref:Transcription termination/antitermination protein NusG n=1 Tax=Ornithobacterium rhinotracheale TaxID=28251 RepID=A0A3R5UVE3_ORNRH|nr:transcription termination/antitermination protein NusG [Ornithobacterium rhinotracheale]QAR31435.1 transcription termination/antitermination factor NusG [Ornithobacterium rhinotracheale]
MSDMKWYVLKTISGRENKVKELIQDEIKYQGLEECLGQIVIPTEKVIQIKNGKKIQRERVFYPGYVMIEVNLLGEVPHIIKNINGVISFLSATKGGDPIPMRDSEIDRMLGRMDAVADDVDMVNIPYQVGETVKVVEGPFANFNGVIEELNEDKRKLKVMVSIFGRKTPLELNYMQVEKI